MSGICGEFNLDGGPVDDSDIRVMTRWLERRGPDGTSILGNGSFGCGHSLLATTPESSVEHQPFADLDSGCVITADARLDYRDELIAQLGIERRLQEIGDAELILRSYLRWGEQCPARLLGDYAFAIWNPRERRLFCARDPFGMRPLCYHYAPGRRFVFASDTRAILLLTEVPHRVSEERIADFSGTQPRVDRLREHILRRRFPFAISAQPDCGSGRFPDSRALDAATRP